MKTTIVPAQITTVEDKIVGNLSFTQVIMFIAALLISVVIYAVFPKPLKLTLYKLPIMFVSSTICFALAIRIRGKILIQWLVLIVNYSLRPQFYTFNKNDVAMREIVFEEKLKKAKAKNLQKLTAKNLENISTKELAKLKSLVEYSNKNVRLRFNKKGEVHATVS